MNKKFVFLSIFLLFLVGCGCTEEAKYCPDGSSVGRQGIMCNFEDCPDTKCEAEHPCPAGMGCYIFQGDSRCISKGMDPCNVCESKKCNIAESYPMQIFCIKDKPTVDCADCPEYSPPAPNFCEDGTIIAPEKDDCGCFGPPKCNKTVSVQKFDTIGEPCQTNKDCKCQVFDGTKFLEKSTGGVCCVGDYLENINVCGEFESNQCGLCLHR